MQLTKKSSHLLSSLLIILFVSIAYSNTLFYPWQLDDYPNIVHNSTIHIPNLSIESLLNSLHAAPYTQTFSRPFSFLTLSINWFYSQQDTFGYHLINIAIHILTSIILYFTISSLLQLETIRKKYNLNARGIFLISLSSTLLWSLHPIQIQAVTYIVQRMSSLSALFSITSILLFIHSFSLNRPTARIFFLLLCFISGLIALLSKENSAILPCSLLLIYYCFFREDKRYFSNSVIRILIAINFLLVVISIYFLSSIGIFDSLFSADHHGNRPFSLLERLLTQPRIILFYLSLIIYPLPSRFSIDHSFELSTSLFDPWITIPSILSIFLILTISLFYLKKHPLLTFPILFFFLNHLVESSFLPLELVFEHRNYLPTLFIFLPATLIIYKISGFYRGRNSFITYSLTAFVTLIIITLTWSTFLRNTKWSSQESLWTDASFKAPLSARPFSYLGQIYGWEKPQSEENLNKAVTYYKKAIGKTGSLKSFDAAIIGNIAAIYMNYRKYAEAKYYYELALESSDKYSQLRFGYANVLVLLEMLDEAMYQLNILLNHGETNNISRIYNLQGLIYLWQGENHKAMKSFQQAIHNSKIKTKYFYNMGIALSRSGHYRQAELLLRSVLRDTPGDILIMFSIIENALNASQTEKAIKYSGNLYKVFPSDLIFASLEEKGPEKYRSAPVNLELISPVIIKAKP